MIELLETIKEVKNQEWETFKDYEKSDKKCPRCGSDNLNID